jgi:hypothetical protein
LFVGCDCFCVLLFLLVDKVTLRVECFVTVVCFTCLNTHLKKQQE